MDPGFSPGDEHRGPHAFLVVVGNYLHLPDANSVRRLTADGRADPDWRLHAPLAGPVSDLVPTPWGGFLASDFAATWLEQSDGTFARQRTPLTRQFPQPDGSFLLNPSALRVSRQNAEGREIPGYGLNGHVNPVHFVSSEGSVLIGIGSGPVVSDRQGRLIVGGNFLSAGGLERPGLVRLLADGRPDPAWNPGGALGIGPTNAADPDVLSGITPRPEPPFMNARPTGLTIGPDDSVVVRVEYVAPRGAPDRRIAVVDEMGSIVGVFPDGNPAGSSLICVQPDGRLLISDPAMEAWAGIPVGTLLRVETNGSLDTSFQVTLDPPGSSVSAMTLDDQGRLWISGSFSAVNGVPRPGLARLLAYSPAESDPVLAVKATRHRIAEGEVLHLAAEVSGSPSANVQWLRDGLPIPGAIHPGLRLPVDAGVVPATFQLMAWNDLGTNVLDLGRTDAGIRSPIPGRGAPQFGERLMTVFPVTRLVPQPDGRILFGAGSGEAGPVPLVGRLTAEGFLDPGFGMAGLVEGVGRVEDLLLRADGTVLVTGSFTSLGGAPASGMAELTPDGRRSERVFPDLDVPSVTTMLELPDGHWMIAGRFSRVSGIPRFRMARLTSDFALDPEFDASPTFEPWQVVDVFALDPDGRLFAGGAGVSFDGMLTSPTPYGLVRLLPDGRTDPQFARVPLPVRGIFPETDGTVVTGMPLHRWNASGQEVQSFVGNPIIPDVGLEPDQRLVRLPAGGFLTPIRGSGVATQTLRRWLPDGRVDDNFDAPTAAFEGFTRITACGVLTDGSVLLAGSDGRPGPLIRRLPADSDSRLVNPHLAGNQLRAELFTQPGRQYQPRVRSSLTQPETNAGTGIAGDGYLSQIGTVVPEDGTEGWLRVLRIPVRD